MRCDQRLHRLRQHTPLPAVLTTVSRAAVEQLLYLMDEAFEGKAEHSLLANLRTVTEDDLLWVPPGGHRSIPEIAGHVGQCKYVYDNHAFGDASMRWDRPGTVPALDREAPQADVIDWLREGHRRLREHVAGLADDDLMTPRRANWGEMRETRWLINVMIQHDLYHAGEINHIRALRQGNDRWAWQT